MFNYVYSIEILENQKDLTCFRCRATFSAFNWQLILNVCITLFSVEGL